MRASLKADCLRLQAWSGARNPPSRLRYVRLALRAEMLPLLLYRISHYFHLRRHYGLAALMYRTNLLMTGCDIHPASRIGPGCLLMHAVGSVIAATIGANASLHAMLVIAPASPLVDLKDAPRLGDNVTVHAGSTILGGVEIAHNVSIGPQTLVQQPVPEQGSVSTQVSSPQTSNTFSEQGET